MVMDLEETEARNDCAGEGQQQFNRPTDRPILAFTVVQQIMKKLSATVTENENVAVITKAVFTLSHSNTNNSSQTSKNHRIQCRQDLRRQKTVGRLKNRSDPVLRDIPETAYNH
jgi:hypothetical protein